MRSTAVVPDTRRPEVRARELENAAQGANKRKYVAQKATTGDTQRAPVTSASIVAGVREALIDAARAPAPQAAVEGGSKAHSSWCECLFGIFAHGQKDLAKYGNFELSGRVALS